MRVYSCATPAKLHVCEAWAKAHNWKLITSENPQYQLGDCAVWGTIRGAKTIRQACRMTGHSYYALDNGYLRRKRYFRVTKNGYAQTVIADRPDDRWNKLGITLLPPRRGGKIMIAESSIWCYKYFDCPNWTGETILELRKHTDRKIIVRHKEMHREIEPDDLRDVYCVVTHSSGVALDALIHGIPAIVTGPGAASAICPADLSLIESVSLPENREKFFHSLAYGQFMLGEFEFAKKTVDELDAQYEHL